MPGETWHGTRRAPRAACCLFSQVSTLVLSRLVWSNDRPDLASMVAHRCRRMVARRLILRSRLTCLSHSMALWKGSRTGRLPRLLTVLLRAVGGWLNQATCCPDPVPPHGVFPVGLPPGVAQFGLLPPWGSSSVVNPSSIPSVGEPGGLLSVACTCSFVVGSVAGLTVLPASYPGPPGAAGCVAASCWCWWSIRPSLLA